MAESEAAKIGVSLFHRISRIANSDFSLDEILGQMVGLAAEILRCDACLIYLHETASDDFVLRASQLPRSFGAATLRMKLGEGVTGWVAQHQTIVALGDNAAKDPRFKTIAAVVEDTYEALLSVPLINRGKTIGVINIHHRDPHPHPEEEVNAIAFIGQQLSSAIAKTLLEDENARLADQSSKEEQRRARLEEQVAQRTAQLKASNDELKLAKEEAEEMARLFVTTPHYSSHNSYTDPTHVRHLAAASFDHLTGKDFESFHGSPFRFDIVSLELTFGGNFILDNLGRALARANLNWYERHAAWVFPALDIRCHLRAVK